MNFFYLLWEFFITGLFSIGGGLATIPFLQSMAERYDWFTKEELVDMIAISESTPGPIGINMATFSGLRAEGIVGGILATLIMVVPSMIIVFLLIRVLNAYKESKTIKDLFYGLRAVSAGLILAALFSIYPKASLKVIPLSLFLLLFFLIRKFPKIHPIFFLMAGFLVSLILPLA
ncbi:chromate transporter [Guggenheimella bovis]